MRKSELAEHHEQYLLKEAGIAAMVANRQFPAVFAACMECFPHIVPAIKYRKQSGITPEAPNFLSFSTICTYAPVLFEHSAIKSLHEFVKATRQVARHENGYAQAVEAAIEREEIARTLWNRLERFPGTLQRELGRELNNAQAVIVKILETWEQLGVVTRSPFQNTYQVYLRTRLDAEVTGVCHSCGTRGRARKEAFLHPIPCQRCGVLGYYHLAAD